MGRMEIIAAMVPVSPLLPGRPVPEGVNAVKQHPAADARRLTALGLVFCLALGAGISGCLAQDEPPVESSLDPTEEPQSESDLAEEPEVEPQSEPNLPPFASWSWHVSERLNPDAGGPNLPASTIPFIIMDYGGPDSDDGAVRLGYWDLATGQVVFDDRPLFTVTPEASTRGTSRPIVGLVWDGGWRIGVAFRDGPTITQVHPSFTLDIISPPTGCAGSAWLPMALALCPSDDPDRFIVLSDGSLVVQSGLAPRANADNGTPGAEPSAESHSFAPRGRLIGLISRDDLLEWAGVDLAESEAGQRTTVLDWYVLDGGVIATNRLDTGTIFVEAGPGNRWAFDGSRIHMATPLAVVRSWDLETGEERLAEAVNAMLKAFETPFSDDMVFPAPPGLFAYGETLFVEYSLFIVKPDDATSEPRRVPTVCVLAVRDGEVIGELTCHDGHLTVRKDSQVTQEEDIALELCDYWWFPGTQWIRPD